MKKFTNQNILVCRVMIIINNGKALLIFFFFFKKRELRKQVSGKETDNIILVFIFPEYVHLIQ